jgi:hypothetical protein
MLRNLLLSSACSCFKTFILRATTQIKESSKEHVKNSQHEKRQQSGNGMAKYKKKLTEAWKQNRASDLLALPSFTPDDGQLG